MKKLIFSLVIATFGILSLSAQLCTPVPPGMVSWWDGDMVNGTTATDIQGSNHGTLNGSTTTFGHVNNAFEFNGVNEELNTNLTINFYNGGVTYEAWINTTDPNGMIMSDGGGATTESGMGLFIESGGRLRLYGTNSQAGVTNFVIRSNQLINDGVFHFVAATWDGTTNVDGVRLYIDGALDGTARANASITSGSTPVFVGGHGIIPHARLNGLIDEVGIFNRALTGCEISNIFTAGSLGKCKVPTTQLCATPPNGMVCWWDGDHVTSLNTVAIDLETINNGSQDALLQWGLVTASGHVGDAFDFDGIDDQLATNFTIGFYNDGVTYDAWVNTTDPNGMIMSDGGGSTLESGMGLFIENGGRLRLYGTNSQAGVTNFVIRSNQLINDGVFHFVAATWDGTTDVDGVRLYIDGALDGTARANASITSGSTPVFVGGHGTIAHARLDGLIDEIEIFNRALTDCEILDLFNAGVSGKCKPDIQFRKKKLSNEALEDSSDLEFNVYPNPSNGKFFVSIESVDASTNLYIFDNFGRMVYEIGNLNQRNNEFDLSNQPKGIYYVKILKGDKVRIKKVLNH